MDGILRQDRCVKNITNIKVFFIVSFSSLLLASCFIQHRILSIFLAENIPQVCYSSSLFALFRVAADCYMGFEICMWDFVPSTQLLKIACFRTVI